MAAEASTLLVGGAERQVGRLFELECIVGLGARALLGQRARHPNRLERLLFHVVRLLGVQRKNLECDL